MKICSSLVQLAILLPSTTLAQVQFAVFPDGDGMVPSIGRDISGDGTTVVGTIGCGSFVWRFDESPVYIGSQDCTRYVQANAVSHDGSVVVGTGQFDDTGYADAFRWTVSTGVEVIGADNPEVATYPSCISDDATVIGGWMSGVPFVVAGIKIENESWSSLSRQAHQLVDCDASGTIFVGHGLDNTGAIWKWNETSGFQTLPLPPQATGVFASAISDDGTFVAGTYWLWNGRPVATRWNPDGSILPIAPNSTIVAKSMSGDGMHVGGYVDSPSAEMIRGFVWSHASGVDTLNWPSLTQGWTVKEVNGFSTDGSAFTGYATKNGQTRAFMLRNVHTVFVDLPPSVAVCRGSDVELPVFPTGYGTPQVQWERLQSDGSWAAVFDGPVSSSSSELHGTQSTTLRIVRVDDTLADSTFRCRVSTQCGTNVGRPIGVRVIGQSPAPCDNLDFNNDCSVFDPLDIADFLSVYSEGPCSTGACNDIDFNNDGALFDPCDIDAFLLVFSEGPCTLCGE
jgi:uncharacterized membrane protein